MTWLMAAAPAPGQAAAALPAAAHADGPVVIPVGHGVNRVEAEGPKQGRQPYQGQGPAAGQGAGGSGPGDQHRKAPADGQHQLGVTKPAFSRGVEQHWRQGRDCQQQAEVAAGGGQPPHQHQQHCQGDDQAEQQQACSVANANAAIGQGTAAGALHQGVDAAVPEVVGDAAGRAHRQSSQHY